MAICRIGYIGRVANDTEAPNRIRELREALGISQAELARRANTEPSTLNKVELGKRGLDQRWMNILAPLLGVAPSELLPVHEQGIVLTDAERAMIERLRAADPRVRETFDRVTSAVLGDSRDEDRAA